LKKYQTIRIDGRREIVLKRTALTLFTCPKCGSSFVTEEFKNEAAFAKEREKRIEQRKQMLHNIYSSNPSLFYWVK